MCSLEQGLTEPRGACMLDAQLHDGPHFSAADSGLRQAAFEQNRSKMLNVKERSCQLQIINGQLPCHSHFQDRARNLNY